MKKSILITGSTDGIGELTARMLAKDGHHVYLHGRNAKKLATVISSVKEESGNNQVDGFTADLADLTAVQELARQIAEQVPQLDVLINNAGVYASKETTSRDGLELRFAVNYVAPFLLTRELLKKSTLSGGSRIINLSSAAQAPVDLRALKNLAPISVRDAYAQSKLALTMWSFNLAREYPELTVIAVNPGSLLNTKMVRECFGFSNGTADKGAKILYALALNDEFTENSGKYFDNDRGNFGRAHQEAYAPDRILQLITTTNNLLSQREM